MKYSKIQLKYVFLTRLNILNVILYLTFKLQLKVKILLSSD